jgi:exodeoxyribonuclease VII large subunit
VGPQPLDLLAAASAEGAWTVSEVTRRARAVVENGMHPLWVRGELTDFHPARSGHWYFALRDEQAQLRCAMYAKHTRKFTAPPTEGMQVFALAQPTVYPEKGEFQLTVVELLSSDRDGMRRAAFQKAKANLEQDGLLDPRRKRPLPPYPRRIAIVTSRDSAVLHDVRVVIARRWPLSQLVLVPATVQGVEAENELCRALSILPSIRFLDVAIVGRGGGSQEDLWAFNSERVARAVAAAPVPVISAVGHETDVTLCDLVADLRAPTPSAAAEAATPDRDEMLEHLGHLGGRLAQCLQARADRVHDRVTRSGERLTGALRGVLDRADARITTFAARLDALSPLAVLGRGYAIARGEDGHVLRRVDEFPPGLRFRLRLTDGEVHAQRTGDG